LAIDPQAEVPADFHATVMAKARARPLPRPRQRARGRERPDDVAHARAPRPAPLIRWLSALWHPPLAGALATAADIPLQEETFYLDEGTIRVTCSWWTATRDRPAALWLQWHVDVTRPGELWVRFTRAAPEAAAVVLAELRLGTALAGEVAWSADTLGFDPSRERWALALVLRELGA
jgi:hypothetical protein